MRYDVHRSEYLHSADLGLGYSGRLLSVGKEKGPKFKYTHKFRSSVEIETIQTWRPPS